jgi:hypothetical protein
MCAQVTMYGFGKMEGVQHHYHDTVHTVEYSKRACCRNLSLRGGLELSPRARLVLPRYTLDVCVCVCVCGWV